MANSLIIQRMLDAIKEFEARKLSASNLEESLEMHMQALEQIGSQEINVSRRFGYRIVAADLADGEQEFEGDEKVSTVLNELRRFLRSLPSEK